MSGRGRRSDRVERGDRLGHRRPFHRGRRHRRRARPPRRSRRIPDRGLRGRNRADHRPPRPHRRALQQRGRRSDRRRRRVVPRRVAARLRRQRLRRREHVARRPARDADRRSGRGRQHVLGRGIGRLGRPRGLLGFEGRGARAHSRDGRRRDSRTGFASTACHRARSRARGSNERSPPSPIPKPVSRRSAGGNHLVAWSRATRSRPRSCTWPATRRSRPAPTSCSTAASPACGWSTEMERNWFDDARFGMFIHWDHASQRGLEVSWPMVGGVFSLPRCQSVTPDEYHALAALVRPDRIRRRRSRASCPRSGNALRGVHHPSSQRVLHVRHRAEQPQRDARCLRSRHRRATWPTRSAPKVCESASTTPSRIGITPTTPRSAKRTSPISPASRRRARPTNRPIASARTCSDNCGSC